MRYYLCRWRLMLHVLVYRLPYSLNRNTTETSSNAIAAGIIKAVELDAVAISQNSTI